MKILNMGVIDVVTLEMVDRKNCLSWGVQLTGHIQDVSEYGLTQNKQKKP